MVSALVESVFGMGWERAMLMVFWIDFFPANRVKAKCEFIHKLYYVYLSCLAEAVPAMSPNDQGPHALPQPRSIPPC